MNAKVVIQQVLLILLLIAIIVTLVLGLWPDEVVVQKPGVLAKGSPKVTRINDESIKRSGFEFVPVAHFSFRGRVLERRNYYYVLGFNLLSFDRDAAVSPIDMLVGWNEMSDEATLEGFRFYLDGREWSWKPDDINDRPRFKKLVEDNIALLHVIPGNSQIDRKLDNVYVGHIVSITGEIVKVNSTRTAYSWGTSKVEESIKKKDFILMINDIKVVQ